MMATPEYIPSLDHRIEKIESCIDCLTEDVSSIKIGMGYKDKYNGEFRDEIERETLSLTQRLRLLEQSNTEVVATLNTAITSMRWTIGVGFGGIISVLLLLISMHLGL